MAFNFFLIEKSGPVATLWLNRPEKRNFMNWDFWHELPLAVAEINADESIKVFIVAAKGASFSIGLDLPDFVERFRWLGESGGAEANQRLHEFVLTLQKGMRAIADSPKPSLAAIHRHCIGGGLDLVSACDIRYASQDVIFSLREVKVAIVADMGSLQRLPYIIGEGATRELALTGRDVAADEALRLGLVTQILPDKDTLYAAAQKTAAEMATNSALVMRGVKYVMNKQRGMDVDRAMDFVALYNSGFLQTAEFVQMAKSFAERKKK
ncbi:MAG: enoyl-CoA hydratase/isomerase family protein [Spirochaetes bacterium]|nr:enoyl-CoA hydratase/isomerase family protein [Spirochaetota bacterium]